MDLSEIKGHENIKRACEIASVGRHSIAIVPVKGFGLSSLIQAFIDVGKIHIKEYEPEYHYNIVIEMTKVPFEKYFSKPCESSADVKERIEKAKEFIKNNELKSDLSKPCIDLLKSSFNKLDLTFKDLNSIIKVARTIASMDFSKEILPQHIAEAILYKNFKPNINETQST